MIFSCCLETLKHKLKGCCPLLQESVRRLKDAIGKGSKSILGQFATNMEHVPFYLQKREDYLRQCPAMLQHAQQVAVFMDKLKVIKDHGGKYEELAAMSKDIPALVQQLRLGSCEKLELAFKDVTLKAWRQVEQKQVQITEEQLKHLNVALKELSLMHPLETEYQMHINKGQQLLQQLGQQKQMNSFMEVCQVLPDVVLPVCNTIKEHLQSMGAQAEFLQDKHTSVMKAVVVRLLVFLNGAWQVEHGMTDFAVSAITCCQSLLQLVKDEPLKKDVATLEVGKELVETLNDFRALQIDDTHSDDAFLKLLLSLKRKLLKYEAKKGAAMVNCKLLSKALDKQYEVAKKLCKAEEEKHLLQKKEKVETSLKALAELAGGHRRGQDWLATCTALSWEQLLQHADETILQVDSEDMVNKQQSLEEACTTFPPFSCCSSVEIRAQPLQEILKYEMASQ